ncbi:MAG: DUF1015 domain-containing protein [Candidatus Aminicenantales bacterium]
MMKVFPAIAIGIPEVLLPHRDIDLQRWAVIACDQHTSEPEYWEKVAEVVGNSPSALHLIYPEVYLKEKEPEVRIKRIKETMRRYLEEGVFTSHEGIVYVERTVNHGKRGGMLLCLDLEQYDYNPGSKTLIRATEGTILERIPPRVKIREAAPVELPHVMVLIDDPEDIVIGPLREKARRRSDALARLYDFDLMLSSGHLTGWLVTDKEVEIGVIRALSRLAEPESFSSRYQVSVETPVLLFAVGDGNHSLATAKTIWEKHKQANPSLALVPDYPLRFTLVEIVNLHDPAIVFEPIHRVLFRVRPTLDLTKEIKSFFGEKIIISAVTDFPEIKRRLKALPPGRQGFGVIKEKQFLFAEILEPKSILVVGSLQSFLDDWQKKGGAEAIDYVHGEETVLKLGRQPGNGAFYLPAMDKNLLFKTVIREGILPRKTFSMGEAWEKRFYLEARRLI